MNKISYRICLFFLFLASPVFATSPVEKAHGAAPASRPNLLLILTDDQSWAHTGIAGYPLVKTPNFDAIAQKGIYFTQGFAAAPTCTSSRSAIISGQDVWRTGSGAVLLGTFPKDLISYQDVLKTNGYETGFTGKPWGPGNQSLRPTVLGEAYTSILKKNPADGISPIDYSKNLNAFLTKLTPGKPFSFWVGISEPHRGPTKYSNDGYAETDGNRFSSPESQKYFPAFLPNTKFAQKDFQGYLQEIEEFDRELARILTVLQDHHALENTLIVITSDNGMPFIGAKADNSYYGVKVPFAVLWGAQSSHLAKTGINDQYMINGIDIAPTFLDAAGIPKPKEMTGISFLPVLTKGAYPESPRNDFVVTGFERHANVRPHNSTYPSRALITKDYMYIRNFLPDRWPMGNPPIYGDGPAFMLWKDVSDKAEVEYRKNWLLSKRPAEELFNVKNDPFQKTNLIATPEGLKKYSSVLTASRKKLQKYLTDTKDPDLKNPDYFSAMPYNQ